MIADSIAQKFSQIFGSAPTLTMRSPGRINLIGEHTDYNNGFVLPAAINKAIFLSISARPDNEIHLHAIDLNDSCVLTLDQLVHNEKSWVNYIIGVLLQIQKKGKELKGFNCVFGGDIPTGAGLSSSAALECGTIKGLTELFGYGFDTRTIALMGQAAENEFVGVKCGIMDQYANMFGKNGHVLRIDCQSLEHAYFPFNFNDIDIVLMDTQVKHSLASSEYNTRREECEAGVAAIQQNHPDVKSLRQATIPHLEAVKTQLSGKVYDRCKYVIEEIQRMIDACALLEQNDLAGFGQKMYETHDGLSKLYEVSCPELDFLVAEARKNGSVIGSRMMGGGFGGCTINLIPKTATAAFVAQANTAYKGEFGREPGCYIVAVADGTGLV